MNTHALFDLPHRPGNCRNSEGAFLTLKDGRVLFAYSRYGEGTGDDGDKADIAGLVSEDGGRTWPGAPRILVPSGTYQNVMSASLLRMTDGRIALFYLRKNGVNDCRPLVRYSADESATWSESTVIYPCKGYLNLNNDRVIRLASGRLLLPIAQHVHAENTEGGRAFFDSRGQFFVITSDDDGATWKVGDERWMLPFGRQYLQEPGAIELNDGRLWAFYRTNTGRQWQSFSSDGGENWTAPKPSRFHSPCSPLSLKRIPATGDLLAVWNDAALAVSLWGESRRLVNGRLSHISKGRTPLAAAVSRNDGRTWSRSRLLEQEPDHGYCYTALHFTEDAVLLAYCCGGGTAGRLLQDLRIRRIPLAWFYE